MNISKMRKRKGEKRRKKEKKGEEKRKTKIKEKRGRNFGSASRAQKRRGGKEREGTVCMYAENEHKVNLLGPSVQMIRMCVCVRERERERGNAGTPKNA